MAILNLEKTEVSTILIQDVLCDAFEELQHDGNDEALDALVEILRPALNFVAVAFQQPAEINAVIEYQRKIIAAMSERAGTAFDIFIENMFAAA